MNALPETDKKHDPLTIAAIAVLACVLTNLLHEGVGHGLACLLVGIKPLGLSSIHLDWDYRNASPLAVRVIASAGTLVNLATALLLGLLLRRSTLAPQTRYFFWLTMSLNLLLGASYLFFTTASFSDWYWFVQGLTPHQLWVVGLPVLGLLLYLPVAITVLRQGLRLFLPSKPGPVRRQAMLLAWLPYVVCGSVSFAAAALYRGSTSVTGMALGQWMGGASLLFYLPFFAAAGPPDTKPLMVARHAGWIGTGVISLVLSVFVLGPGIVFP